ncbi:MAG: UDP-3-O-(3-hydroxymyristoyl)glucosamine N-acyltransferase [Gammaproteobacteria bacterium]|nr:UDP-3-O-(3-hydroxymyristoyl)glucosamine N-acyltransferase [Gammaproteobacteria bacterium]
MGLYLSELARQTGARLEGDDCLIEGIAEISAAQSGDIAFISNPKYLEHLAGTSASALIIKPEFLDDCPVPALITANPRLAYAKVANLLYPARKRESGISSNAIISATAKVGNSSSVAAGVVIYDNVVIGSNAQIGANCVIEEDVIIGENTRISPNVTVGYGSRIGDGCIIHSGVVLGADGFGFVKEGDSYLKIPQIGNVHIGNDVEIGANTTIDRGALENTVIGHGVKLDNQIQIAHGVTIGDNTVISAACAIAGSTHIGRGCLIGGLVGIVEHLEITDNVMITGRTMVTHSITEPGSYSSSTPMDTTANWRKNSARFRRLDELAKRVTKLEKTNKSAD